MQATSMNHYFLEYFRCAEDLADFRITGKLSNDAGFFHCGTDTICYGRTSRGSVGERPDHAIYDVWGDISVEDSKVILPFDPSEIAENLLRERYVTDFLNPAWFSTRLALGIYYLLRPYLTSPIRQRLQKAYLHSWRRIRFPEWPVDFTVDRIHQKLLALAMQAKGAETVPFIWFWPDGFESCAILTHDVEELEGRDYCEALMDQDERYGFRSSFQVVPETRYPVPESYLRSIISRGFEVNVHDLNHDGRLYSKRDEFLRRAEQINEYGRDFGARGFRSGVLYRNPAWYDALDFSYDMSIPNVAHLDPQHGGCCTVMPYFIGKLVELPLTSTQDYTLFNILGHYSMELWERQIELVRSNHGLVHILIHPDYVREPRALAIYKCLLRHLSKLRDTGKMWTPLPKDVAEWWRLRNGLTLVAENGKWKIEGLGSDRARIAYACLDGERIKYVHNGETSEAGSLCNAAHNE
jgi:hypothetical protein